MQIGNDISKRCMMMEDLSLLKSFESISYGGTPLIKCLKLTLNTKF